MTQKTNLQFLFSLPVIVAALGYFVDIYDLLLFGIVRIPSLNDLGVATKAELSSAGSSILSWQMTGLLLGGILWGVLGDKKGRLSVLFGSIITYSLANIACGFVQNVETYKVLRLIAGIGLAGELGAGITLVSEILPKNIRSIGTSLVAGFGLMGAVVAYFTVQLFAWRNAYWIGGGLGISLLLLRIGVFESGMFKNIQSKKTVAKGNFFSFFTNKERLMKYLKCIAIGLPTWFVIGILVSFGNEFFEEIKPGKAIMMCYVGISAGDLFSGFFSHWLASRKKAVGYMLLFSLIFACIYLYAGIKSADTIYLLCIIMGFANGYWAMFVTIGAEQFGTNLRATAATTIPNMVRGTVVATTALFGFLKPNWGVTNAAAGVGFICFALAFIAIATIEESHGKDLDYLEE